MATGRPLMRVRSAPAQRASAVPTLNSGVFWLGQFALLAAQWVRAMPSVFPWHSIMRLARSVKHRQRLSTHEQGPSRASCPSSARLMSAAQALMRLFEVDPRKRTPTFLSEGGTESGQASFPASGRILRPDGGAGESGPYYGGRVARIRADSTNDHQGDGRADRDVGVRHDGLSRAERQELMRLRRENRQLKIERDILARGGLVRAGAVPPKGGTDS